MDAYSTKVAEAFAGKVLKLYYAMSVAEDVTNQDYEDGLIAVGSRINILTFGEIEERTYTGANMADPDDLEESNCQLVTDQYKSFYFKIKSIDKFKSYIKKPESTILEQTASRLKLVVDQFVLGFYGDVGAGNRVGTDYTTGDVTVDVTTGLVTGNGTTFTASMVGRGFKADGHTKWYRVKTFTNTTSIVIEDDSDDNTSAYTGGAIAGGSSYTIEAVTPIQVTKDNIYSKVLALKAKLTNAEIPSENRWMALPTEVVNLVRQAPEFIADGSAVGAEVPRNGRIGRISDFVIYEVSDRRIGGNSTDGWHVIGGHKSGITMAMALTENGIEDLIGNFGKAYKSLHVYGAKVADERRKALVELYCKL